MQRDGHDRQTYSNRDRRYWRQNTVLQKSLIYEYSTAQPISATADRLIERRLIRLKDEVAEDRAADKR